MLSPRVSRAGVVARGRRRTAAVLALACAAAMLTACGSGGFQPLYGSANSVGGTTDERFARVDISPIPGRVGQRIRNELLFERSSTSSNTRTTDRRLEVNITENVLTTLVTITGNSTGQVYQLEANYRLVETATQKVMFQGRSLGRASFERFESVYSNIRAREDAENRAAASVANDIRMRLAAHLSRT